MSVVLTASSDFERQLRSHLLNGHHEQVAFLLAESRRRNQLELLLTDIYAVPANEFEIQSSYHVTLTDDVRPKVIKWAWDHGACLVEAHSHRGPWPAAFSPTDLDGLRDFVPHVRWRLRGSPYVALVFTERDFDALGWIDSDSLPIGVEALVIDGKAKRPTNRTVEMLRKERLT